jgi:hypothetical protein
MLAESDSALLFGLIQNKCKGHMKENKMQELVGPVNLINHNV